MPLTLEERERRAYIEGRVEEARLLAGQADAIDEKSAELEDEVADLKKDNARLQKVADDLEEELHAEEDKVATIRGELEEAREENAHVRALHLACLLGEEHA